MSTGRPLRRIAVEEAFAVPEQLDGYRDLARSDWGDGDVRFWRAVLGGAFADIVADLLNVGPARLAMMDRLGVDVQLLSLTSPGVQVFAPARASALARLANDRLAETIARHPARFAGLATIPVQDPAAAVIELERAIGLGMKGTIVNSHTNGRYLDEEVFWPVLEAAEALDAPIYIHPRTLPEAAIGPYQAHNLTGGIWGYAAETGLHAMRLLASGVLARFPKLKIVLGHMGEGIPWWLYRIDYMWKLQSRRVLRGSNMLPSELFRQHFWITTSGMNDPDALGFALGKLGYERILWAMDYPYQEPDETVRWLGDMDLDAGVKAAVFGGNAERLFRIAAN